ncbi:MAG: acyl-CoA dehydrogenase family protein [Thermoleophilia bacterium]|nr:acyl-CoA dehydrogenase family protein [Thermoleophilia bacterium]
MSAAILGDEHLAIQRLARDFAEGEIAPHAAEWNRQKHVPMDQLRAMGDLGFLGVTVPEDLGGAGLDAVSLCLVVEELARADAGTSIAVAVQNGLVASPLARFGRRAQQEEWLPRLTSGEVFGAYALTEPGVGSDTAALATTATQVSGGWGLHGSKMWISNGGFAEVFIIFARTGGPGASGVSAFVSGLGDGFTVGQEIPKMGLATSSTVELAFHGLHVTDAGLVGELGHGLKVALETLDGGRITVAAQACGIAQAALDLAVEYATSRVAFGGPIARFQGVQFPIADIATKLDAARLLMLHAARLRDAGLPHSSAGAKAKLFASQVAVEAADTAVQTLGGYGYSTEYPAERYYRDAKITELYEGTSQIQRMVIARDLLGAAARG